MQAEDYLRYPVVVKECYDGSKLMSINCIEGLTNFFCRNDEEPHEQAVNRIRKEALQMHQKGRQFPRSQDVSYSDDDEIIFADVGWDTAIKLLIRNYMLEAKIKPKELSERTGLSPQQLNAALHMEKSTKLEILRGIFAALGLKLSITLTAEDGQ